MKQPYRYLLSIGIGIALGSTMFSNAATTFQSSGKIKYTDQATGNTVMFDSEDFATIENNITTGKNNILQSLQDIKTYLDANGNVVQYEQPDSFYSGIPEFDKLAEAVSKSQEVPTLEDRTITDKEGNKLYYKSEDAKNSRNIMESTTTDPGFADAEIKGYTPATADNLSAGTAAWVDGELILGNGSDNAAYKNYIPLVYANFKSHNFSHFIYDVKKISKITMIMKAGTTSNTEFWGSVQEIPTRTITTVDGESYEVYENSNGEIFKPQNLGGEKIPVKGGLNYVYTKYELDVENYNYLHILMPDKEYRDWIVYLECEYESTTPTCRSGGLKKP